MSAPSPDGGRSDAYWTAAARPTLFTASAWPDLVIAVLLSHLMSPRTWELAARAAPRRDVPPAERLAAIQHFVNTRFYHAGKFDFARFWGLQERDTITDPLERAESDYAMSALIRCMPCSISDAETVEMMVTWLKQGLCPLYAYPAIEVVSALPQLCEGTSRRTLGVTSCLDECVLIAALGVASGGCRLSDLLMLGSPFHYSLFVLPPEGPGRWLNGKRGMVDEATWQASVAGKSAAETQAIVDDKMVLCDRVLTTAGYCRLPDGPATLAASAAKEMTGRLARFLGVDLRQGRQAVACAVSGPETDDASARVSRLEGCAGPEEFAQRVRAAQAETGHPLFEAALYASRAADVKNPGFYVAAAQRGFRVLIRSAEVDTPEDALAIERSVTGTQSIFGDAGRLALPDEALLLNTASANERALLLYTLLTLSPTLGEEARSVARLTGEPKDWRLTWKDRPLGAGA